MKIPHISQLSQHLACTCAYTSFSNHDRSLLLFYSSTTTPLNTHCTFRSDLAEISKTIRTIRCHSALGEQSAMRIIICASF